MLQYFHVQHLTGAAYSAKREVCKILNTHDYHCAPNLTLQDDVPFYAFSMTKRGLQGVSHCCNLGYRLFAFTHKIFKNSEKTIKYRFFRGRQSEIRSISVPYSNYKLYFEDKCLESVLICVFSLFLFRFFSFAHAL